jgi:hypothetical protein
VVPHISILGYSSGEKDQELTDLEHFAIDSAFSLICKLFF